MDVSALGRVEMNKPKALPAQHQLDFVDDGAAAVLLNTPTRARQLLWCTFAFFVVAIIWAAWAKEGANKRGNSSRLTQSFHFFLFEPFFSPVNALNDPI